MLDKKEVFAAIAARKDILVHHRAHPEGKWPATTSTYFYYGGRYHFDNNGKLGPAFKPEQILKKIELAGGNWEAK